MISADLPIVARCSELDPWALIVVLLHERCSSEAAADPMKRPALTR